MKPSSPTAASKDEFDQRLWPLNTTYNKNY